MDEILRGGGGLDVPWVPKIMNYKYTKCFSLCLLLRFQKCIGEWFGLTCVDLCWTSCLNGGDTKWNLLWLVIPSEAHWTCFIMLDEKMLPLNSQGIKSSRHLNIIICSACGYLFWGTRGVLVNKHVILSFCHVSNMISESLETIEHHPCLCILLSDAHSILVCMSFWM